MQKISILAEVGCRLSSMIITHLTPNARNDGGYVKALNTAIFQNVNYCAFSSSSISFSFTPFNF